MKKLWQPTILFWAVLAFMVQGCNNDDDKPVIKEKAVYVARTIGPDGTAGEIMRDNWHKVIVEDGPGSFISAVVSKKGGNTRDLTTKTTVRLWLDRKPVSIKSFEVARATGLSRQNYSGIVWLEGENNVESLVLGYQEPLFFSRVLELSVKVDDPEVDELLVYVTFTREDIGEDEDTGGGDGESDFP